MPYEMEDLAASLKAARVKKGLSQRALSQRTGVPQSHISKIEAGDVDLRVSSLVAIANAIDLELTLVPKGAVQRIQSIAPDLTPNIVLDPPRPAYRLDGEDDV
jgi:transcriptional regulator with XRE-family HTH domain